MDNKSTPTVDPSGSRVKYTIAIVAIIAVISLVVLMFFAGDNVGQAIFTGAEELEVGVGGILAVDNKVITGPVQVPVNVNIGTNKAISLRLGVSFPEALNDEERFCGVLRQNLGLFNENDYSFSNVVGLVFK